MSRSAGPGSPLNFRCTRCKRGDWRDRERGLRFVATGKTKKAPHRKHHARGIRSSNTAYEYRCLTCKHVGWSTHNDVERKWKQSYGDGDCR